MNRITFFNHLRQSGLLGRQALDEAAARFSDTARGQAIARALVAESALTEFQAKKLLAGKPKQLHLGPYRILDQLSRGLTGPVFKAEHRSIGRIVAIKVIHPRAFDDSRALDLFTREIRAAAQLHHPGIVTPYDVGVTRGKHFLIMEYVDGPSLQSLVQRDGPLPVGLARELMRQAAVALQYAHEKGLVHRSIKPAHLLIAHPLDSSETHARCPLRLSTLTATPMVKIIAFGLARLHHAGIAVTDGTIAVEPGTGWGTGDYLAPEQAEDVHAGDIRSDLYSLGCSFHYALTGHVPFAGDNGVDNQSQPLLPEAASEPAVRSELPAALAEILQRLMAKKPAERFQTPAQLVQELADGCPARENGALATLPDVGHVSNVPPHNSSAGPPAGQRSQSGRVQGLMDQSAGAHDTEKELPPAATAPLPLDAAFLENWRRWTALVESFVEGRSSHQRLGPQTFQLLHRQLLADCQVQVRSADGVRREFFERLTELVKPWLNQEVLLRTDREILSSLLWLCLQANRGLHEMAEAEARRDGTETILGGVLSLFRKRRI
jgi:serine/threonine-protein kinase